MSLYFKSNNKEWDVSAVHNTLENNGNSFAESFKNYYDRIPKYRMLILIGNINSAYLSLACLLTCTLVVNREQD